MRVGDQARSDLSPAPRERRPTPGQRPALPTADAHRSRRRWPRPLVGVLLLVPLALAISATTGSSIPLLVALLLVVSLLALVQRSHPTTAVSGRTSQLATPWQLALAVSLVAVVGSLAAIALSLFLNGLGVGGSGATLLEVALVICVLCPCYSLGAKCGRWWSFSGSLPMLALVAIGPTQPALLACLAISSTLQLGSFRRSRRAPPRSRATRAR